MAHTRVMSAVPMHGEHTVASWKTMQLPLPAAATKTACSWNDSTFAHACDTGAAKKYALAVRNSIAQHPALPDVAELLAVVRLPHSRLVVPVPHRDRCRPAAR